MTGYQMTHQPVPFDITDNAACRGSRVMFGVVRHARRGGLDWEPAKAICAVCPVRGACLAHALKHGETEGMWGGLTPDEREMPKAPLTITCVQCGEDFMVEHSLGANPKLCSDECRRLRVLEQGRAKRAGRPRPMVPCVVCGEPFERMRGTDKTCSARCRRQHNTNLNSARRAARRPPLPCVVCGVVFAPPRTTSKACSDDCRRLAEAARLRSRRVGVSTERNGLALVAVHKDRAGELSA